MTPRQPQDQRPRPLLQPVIAGLLILVAAGGVYARAHTSLTFTARSLPDARDIVDELTAAGGKLNIGGRCTTPPARGGFHHRQLHPAAAAARPGEGDGREGGDRCRVRGTR